MIKIAVVLSLPDHDERGQVSEYTLLAKPFGKLT